MWISAALQGPAQTKLLRPLSDVIGGGVMELNRCWDASEPIFNLEYHCQEFEEGVGALRALLAWADEHGVKVTLYETDWPLDGSEDEAPEPEAREYILNRIDGVLSRMSREEDRPPLEIAERALCLIVLHVRAKGNEQRARELIEEYGVGHAFTAEERRYLKLAVPDIAANRHYTWSIEAAAVLLWALGLFELPPVTDQVDVGRIVEIVKGKNASHLAAEAKEPILNDQEDWPSADLYDLHWAVRDARLHGRPDPTECDPDVVVERHYAFQWLETRAPWDEVDTST